MSWLYSRALVEEYSEACSSDGEQFAPSSSTPTPQAYWSHGKTTAHSRLSRYGMTLERLTDDRGEELLTWYLAVSRARTSAQPAEALGSQDQDRVYGESSLGFLGRFDRDTHSLRTAQSSLLADSTESLRTLPRWGSMRDGELYRQRTPERLTSAKGSGLWPTPTVIDAGTGRTNRSVSPNAATRPTLAIAARLFPTPTAADSHGHTYQRDRGQKGKERPTLVGVVTGWLPTPTVNDAKNNGAPSQAARNAPNLNSVVGGKLSPRWVEWLMNWPVGWTAFDPLPKEQFDEWEYRTKDGAKNIRDGEVRIMWWDDDPSATPYRPRLHEQRTEQCEDSLPDMPQRRAHESGRLGKGESERVPMRDMQCAVSAEANETINAVRESELPEREGQTISRITLGMKHRVGQLRALGNGQVSAVARFAWELLA